jgi:hypothetical protein
MIPFSVDAGAITARLTRYESGMLRTLAEQLIDLLGDRRGTPAGDALYAQLGIGGASSLPLDPALARLLPDAYRGDEEAASEHRRFTERGLVDRKVANAHAVIASLSSREVRLDPVAVQAWLRTLTDLRLTIAARLQIEEDGDEGIGDDAMLAVYDWLGYLQGTLIECLDLLDSSSASGQA